MACSVARVQTSAQARPLTKELFQIIPAHMMNRGIIPGRKKGVRRCPVTVDIAGTLIWQHPGK